MNVYNYYQVNNHDLPALLNNIENWLRYNKHYNTSWFIYLFNYGPISALSKNVNCTTQWIVNAKI